MYRTEYEKNTEILVFAGIISWGISRPVALYGIMDRMDTQGSFSSKKAIAVSLMLIAFGVVIGSNFGAHLPWANGATDALPPPEADFAPLYRAWYLLDQNFAPATSTASTSSARW